MLENYERLVSLLTQDSDKARFATPKGIIARSYKGWLEAHNGQKVDTLQASFPDNTSIPTMPWAPANRVITTRATFVLFNDSRRDYKGVKVLASDDNIIVVTDGEQVWAHTTNTATTN